MALGVFGYALFPPPLPQAGLGLLLGFAIISSTFSWLVARRYEIEDDLRGSQQIISRSERRLQAIIDAEPACVKLVRRTDYCSR